MGDLTAVTYGGVAMAQVDRVTSESKVCYLYVLGTVNVVICEDVTSG